MRFEIFKYIILFLLFVTAHEVFSNNLTKILYDSEQELILYFENNLPDYNSELSENKLKFTLKLQQTATASGFKPVPRSDFFRDITVNIVNNETHVIIYTNEKIGYTIAKLPFSNALKIDFFDWQKLSETDDLYRLGLLALEDNISEPAKDDLLKATQAKHYNAAAFLGLLLLNKGKYNSAKANLLYAANNNSNIADIFAALSEIEKYKGNIQLSEKYKQHFLELTKLNDIATIELSDNIEPDNEYSEPIEHLLPINDFAFDASEIEITEETSELNEKFKGIFSKQDNELNDAEATSTSFLKPIYFAIIGIIILAILISYFYLRWRKQKLLELEREIKKRKFKQDMKKYPKPSSAFEKQLAAQAYEQNKTNTEKQTEKPQNIVKKTKPEATKEVPANKIRVSKDTLQNRQPSEIIDFIASIKAEGKNKPKNENPSNFFQPRNAKLELASHLAEEQQKIKQQKLLSISESISDFDSTQIIETAKKLGIEQSCLEMKQNITDLEKDSKKQFKILSKFRKK